MADTYIWHDFCGQASGPDLLNIYYKYFGTSAIHDQLLAHNENGELIIDNKDAYQAVLDGSQCSLSFSNGAKLYIYRDGNPHAYLRVKDASITFTFPENRVCKIKYYTNQGSSAGYHSWDSSSGSINVPASDINFLYEFNYQTSIATNMAYRDNGSSYLKYVDFLTDSSDNSNWNSNDANSVGGINIYWTNTFGISHYSIPNYYIGQQGNSARGMRKINADGFPDISSGNNNPFHHNSTPTNLSGSKTNNWNFIDWWPELWYGNIDIHNAYYDFDWGDKIAEVQGNDLVIHYISQATIIASTTLTNNEFFMIEYVPPTYTPQLTVENLGEYSGDTSDVKGYYAYTRSTVLLDNDWSFKLKYLNKTTKQWVDASDSAYLTKCVKKMYSTGHYSYSQITCAGYNHYHESDYRYEFHYSDGHIFRIFGTDLFSCAKPSYVKYKQPYVHFHGIDFYFDNVRSSFSQWTNKNTWDAWREDVGYNAFRLHATFPNYLKVNIRSGSAFTSVSNTGPQFIDIDSGYTQTGSTSSQTTDWYLAWYPTSEVSCESWNYAHPFLIIKLYKAVS